MQMNETRVKKGGVKCELKIQSASTYVSSLTYLISYQFLSTVKWKFMDVIHSKSHFH